MGHHGGMLIAPVENVNLKTPTRRFAPVQHRLGPGGLFRFRKNSGLASLARLF